MDYLAQEARRFGGPRFVLTIACLAVSILWATGAESLGLRMWAGAAYGPVLFSVFWTYLRAGTLSAQLFQCVAITVCSSLIYPLAVNGGLCIAYLVPPVIYMSGGMIGGAVLSVALMVLFGIAPKSAFHFFSLMVAAGFLSLSIYLDEFIVCTFFSRSKDTIFYSNNPTISLPFSLFLFWQPGMAIAFFLCCSPIKNEDFVKRYES